MKYIVKSHGLAKKWGIEVGGEITLDPSNPKDKVSGRIRLGFIFEKPKGKKKSKKAETAEAPVETE